MLSSKQRKYLSSLAANIQPTVMLGKDGSSSAVKQALSEELSIRELVKLRFVANKEERKQLAEELAASADAELVRVIGNVAVFYRPFKDIDKRQIHFS